MDEQAWSATCAAAMDMATKEDGIVNVRWLRTMREILDPLMADFTPAERKRAMEIGRDYFLMSDAEIEYSERADAALFVNCPHGKLRYSCTHAACAWKPYTGD